MRNQYFNGSRFLQLFKLELINDYRNFFIASLAIFAFLMMVIMIMAEDHDFEDFHGIWYPIVLLGGGYLFTSASFSELNKASSRMGYLSLPASTFEKFLSKFLITNLGFILFTTLAYGLFALISNSISQSYFGFTFQEFNPFREYYPIILIVYITTHSIFLLGAITYNRFAIFKTFLSIVAIYFILAAIIYFGVRIIFHDAFDGMFSVRNNILYHPSDQLKEFVEHSLPKIAQFISYFIIVPLILAAGYFKLKEREV